MATSPLNRPPSANTRHAADRRPSIIQPARAGTAPDNGHDDNMANAAVPQNDNLPSPGIFSGKATENGVEFLQRFELWANYRNLNDAARLNAFALLLRDCANLWFRVLPDDNKDTWAHLKQSFNQRFWVEPAHKLPTGIGAVEHDTEHGRAGVKLH